MDKFDEAIAALAARIGDRRPRDVVTKPQPAAPETKADVTTRVAREIVDDQSAEQAARIAALRAKRLARDADQPEPPPAKKAATRSSAR